MRILMLGAGGTGGYFGGRLAQAGVDIEFLVRPARAASLREKGLRLRSLRGDADVSVTTVTTEALAERVRAQPYDLVILTCKAYDLDSAIEAIAPAVGEDTRVLPLLNGLLHYPTLDARFGGESVLGGLCFISATLGSEGEIRHMGKPASMTFGLRASNAPTDVLQHLAQACSSAEIDHVLTDDIGGAQWIKWSFLATLAASTCLSRGSVGQIMASEGGRDLIIALHEECLAVAAASGQPVPEHEVSIARQTLTQAGSPMVASMQRDLVAGRQVEALQIVGDLVHRARVAGIAAPLLEAAWIHLQVYQSTRAD